jgi:hypothetical protein
VSKHDLTQLGLMASSCFAIMLLTSKSPRTRAWGCFIGFAGQPFWFYTAKQNLQWGIMIMSFWYAAMYVRGFFGNRKQLQEADGRSLLHPQKG